MAMVSLLFSFQFKPLHHQLVTFDANKNCVYSFICSFTWINQPIKISQNEESPEKKTQTYIYIFITHQTSFQFQWKSFTFCGEHEHEEKEKWKNKKQNKKIRKKQRIWEKRKNKHKGQLKETKEMKIITRTKYKQCQWIAE